MKKVALFCAVLGAIFFSGCAKEESKTVDTTESSTAPAADTDAAVETAPAADAAPAADTAPAADAAATTTAE